MNFNSFVDEVKKKVSEMADGECAVTVSHVVKNNGVKRTGVTLKKPGDLITPTIYLEDWYGAGHDVTSVNRAAKHIVEVYRSSSQEKPLDPETLFTPESIRNNVVFRLVNKIRNLDLLKKVPHRDFLDLSLVYYLLVRNSRIGEGGIMVRNENCDDWGISQQELDAAATINTKRLLPPDYMGIGQMLDQLTGRERASSYNEIEEKEEYEDLPMLVLTNSTRQFGACYMTDPEVLSLLAGEFHDDIYILPSSVHECLILPASFSDDPEELGSIVREINSTQVSAEEFLADSVYLYDSENRQTQIVA